MTRLEGDPARTVDQETMERVERIFRKQRRLTFSVAVVFFACIFLIPYLTINAEWWYGRPVWGGLTPNFLVVGILFHIVYWLMGLFYTIHANRLEEEALSEEVPQRLAAGVGKGEVVHG
ncbi:MAG TPA: DUF485 domain-containing protein [Firmicutes bacterium]|nr:DUF485 domain-containing protein [Bacillota bacterium]